MDQRQQNEFYCRGFSPSAQAPRTEGPGGEWDRPRDLPWPDDGLRRAFSRSRGAFCRQTEDGGFCLAYPLDCRCPFPLPPLFCFAQARCLGQRGWWVFSFGPGGVPRFRKP